MNEIFIICQGLYGFCHLNFSNYINEFYFHNKKYNFSFISKDKLQIFNNDLDVILYTYDSFIYTDNIKELDFFKKYNFIHNDWFDQCILKFKENKIIRIKDRDQFGHFYFDKENLIIEWDFWGKEVFIQHEDDNYVQEKYKLKHLNLNDISIHKSLSYKCNKNTENILIFIHCCAVENGISILIEQLEYIHHHGLFDICKKIIINISGSCIINLKIQSELFSHIKVEINYSEYPIYYHELHTINTIKTYIDELEGHHNILYIHTKGVRKAGNIEVVKSWRHMMEYFLIKNYLFCTYLLDNKIANTLGNNIINTFDKEDDKSVLVNDKHCFHYSGNFWWASSEYIKKLDKLNISENKELIIRQRYQAENWILSKKEIQKTGILYQDNSNLHPYHRVVFQNYLDRNIYLKLI